MKIVADTDSPHVETTLNDVVRMAEVYRSHMYQVIDRQTADIPDAFVDDVCRAVTMADLLCEAVQALRAEWYANFQKPKEAERTLPKQTPKLRPV